MDLIRRTVTRNGLTIELLPKEFALLEYFMRNEGRVLSRTMLLEQVWDFTSIRRPPWSRPISAGCEQRSTNRSTDPCCTLSRTWDTASMRPAELGRSAFFRFALALTLTFLAAYLVAGIIAFRAINSDLHNRVVRAVELSVERYEDTFLQAGVEGLISSAESAPAWLMPMMSLSGWARAMARPWSGGNRPLLRPLPPER